MSSSDALSQLIESLKSSGFEGDIEYDYAARVVAATDNSIYQVMPEAIVYPRVEQDINRAMSCVNKHRHDGFSLCARGACTGTNGQSLSQSIVLDCSRHLNQIIEFDKARKEITLQPGVVLDQLNEYLAEHGLFFPIDISSSSRATIGGMVATDASGKGSLIYGKTSRYVETIDLVLADGSDYAAKPHKIDELTRHTSDYPGFLLPVALQLEQQRDEINRVFPDMNRGLTGYNLQQCIESIDTFNPCYLLAGSEGTLGISKRITLTVIPKPTHRVLTVIFYSNFQDALEHIESLLTSQPAAIEMLDDKILTLAQNDSVWFEVSSMLDKVDSEQSIKAVNYVEHVGYSVDEVKQYQHNLQQILDQNAGSHKVILSKSESDPKQISALWKLRKRAVGLLGKSQNGKRGVAFVEDTAVPPKNLVSYINGFRQILDSHHLEYGMYGHADAGVLHVRPVLDLLQKQDRALIRQISDQVAELALQNNGVLWGEHGRGFRGEYTPLFFGEKLYPVLCEIKNYFDPYNLLNPGKLVTPSTDEPLIRLDKVIMRGQLDNEIKPPLREKYASSLACNGNGTCHSYKLNEAMCPSYKATNNKLYSPKGRAAMLREWLRLKNKTGNSTFLEQLENGLFNSLQLCLSCKSCTSTCPLQVDIPDLKSRFLENWYQTKPRPLSSFYMRHFESLIAVAQKMPGLSNWFLNNGLTAGLMQKLTGLNRLPEFTAARFEGATSLTRDRLEFVDKSEKAVILLRDNYMNSFDHDTLQASCNLLTRLGYQVYLSELIHNGKLLYVKGYRKQFRSQAQQVILQVEQLAQTGFPLISCETMTRLMFDQEYSEILQQKNELEIFSIESFLTSHIQPLTQLTVKNSGPVTLLPHCMEQTSAQDSSGQWKLLLENMGIDCEVINAGCCGMSGLFGHEINNNQLSDDIFKLYWNEIAQDRNESVLLASGFSCRCQLKNKNYPVKHPVQYLDQVLE